MAAALCQKRHIPLAIDIKSAGNLSMQVVTAVLGEEEEKRRFDFLWEICPMSFVHVLNWSKKRREQF